MKPVSIGLQDVIQNTHVHLKLSHADQIVEGFVSDWLIKYSLLQPLCGWKKKPETCTLDTEYESTRPKNQTAYSKKQQQRQQQNNKE